MYKHIKISPDTKVIFEKVSFSDGIWDEIICKKINLWRLFKGLSCFKSRFVECKSTVPIVCWYNFRCFEDEEFADRLIKLFMKAKRIWTIIRKSNSQIG